MAPACRKVIVLGLDGFEPRFVERLLGSGALPNFGKVRQAGGYARLRTTTPALTPTAWSTFATSRNPGGHGIFDFVHRDPKTYLPIMSLTRYEQKNAFVQPKAINQRQGTPIWQVLSDAGVPSTIVRCPGTFPPDPIFGRMLAGVGVPDLRGGLGTATFYSSAPDVEAGESERAVQVSIDKKHRQETVVTHLIGPRAPKGDDFKLRIELHLDPAARRVELVSDGQPRSLQLREGEWSEWLKVKFKTGLLQSVSGMLRFYLVQTAPVFELYASPVNFDPDAPVFPFTSPPEYGRELSSALGTFYTTGMVEDHGGLVNGRIDETAYIDQCSRVLDERRRMMLFELERQTEGLFFCLFDTPDRLQHMFWRFLERDHPANSSVFRDDLAGVIDDHYRACDAIIGEALGHVDDQTLFIILSDHGVSSFRRGLNVNTWLYQQGLLALEEGVKPGPDAGDLLRHVDWAHTRAYAYGLGGVYLNLKGREGRGTVESDDADSLKRTISRELTGLTDPADGQLAVRSAMPRENVYSGPCTDLAPDVVINFAEGYRASWGTPMGAVPLDLFEDNQKKWAGDHAIDPSLVPGVLFMNRQIRGQSPGLADVGPTILAALGLTKTIDMEGDSLLQCERS
jgi:predicted AlkP superfamily phosphohydrolase/phosphomutase